MSTKGKLIEEYGHIPFETEAEFEARMISEGAEVMAMSVPETN